MENSTLFNVYLMTWITSVAGIHLYGNSRHLNHGLICLSHAVPSVVALSMTCIFVIGGGASVAQIASSIPQGMNLWSLWFGLWPLFLFATFVAGVAQALLTLDFALNKSRRPWAPVTTIGTALCTVALVTVLYNFPDA